MSDKPKRVMSEEQLAKLAVAREKALAVKRAMKGTNDEAKVRVLQEKIDKVNKKKAVPQVKSAKKAPEPIAEPEMVDPEA